MKGVLIWVLSLWIVIRVGLSRSEAGLEELNAKEGLLSFLEKDVVSPGVNSLLVPLTLIQGAASKGAVCLDGTPHGYYLDRGFGSGSNSWLIQSEGDGWCNTIRSCLFCKTTRCGSSKFMEKQINFTGILSDKAEENPDFYNWNRVKLRYCDGASFAGEGQNEANQLYFRGQRIWYAAMEERMAKGMQNAEQFVYSLVANIKTPMFLLNAAYDAWQARSHLLNSKTSWKQLSKAELWDCLERSLSNSLQDFRTLMLNALNGFLKSDQNGLFINSCFAHCQSDRQDTWYENDSPRVGNKAIAVSVGDWFFDRMAVKAIDYPYPSDKTCHNLIFNDDVTSTIMISELTRVTFTLLNLLSVFLITFKYSKCIMKGLSLASD